MFLAYASPDVRTVLCHGCFDLLHLGHIRHLKEAKSLGDRLIVSVTTDRFVRKGAGRPVFNLDQRMEALRALSFVDDVIPNDAPNAHAIIEQLKPSVYVKGVDYDNKIDANLDSEIAAVQAYGGRFHVTKTDKWSSTQILNGERLTEPALVYLDKIKKAGYIDKIQAAFDRADKLRIAFVGETIVDEYRYVSALGKASKEPILVTVAQKSEAFQGGIVAASLQGDWTDSSIVTISRPMYKTRFVESGSNQKLFEVYSEPRIELEVIERLKFQEDINKAVRESDVVVVIDFGHGLMGEQERAAVANAKFLAVNAQTNAGNKGYNSVLKYDHADYICIDEPEARFAMQMQDEPVDRVAVNLGLSTMAAQLVITHGRHGCLCYQPGPDLERIPAFATHGLDTMGAGDAFLAVTAPLIAAGLPLEHAAFVGNVAGGIKVGIVGHTRNVGREELLQNVEALLK